MNQVIAGWKLLLEQCNLERTSFLSTVANCGNASIPTYVSTRFSGEVGKTAFENRMQQQ